LSASRRTDGRSRGRPSEHKNSKSLPAEVTQEVPPTDVIIEDGPPTPNEGLTAKPPLTKVSGAIDMEIKAAEVTPDEEEEEVATKNTKDYSGIIRPVMKNYNPNTSMNRRYTVRTKEQTEKDWKLANIGKYTTAANPFRWARVLFGNKNEAGI